MLQPQSRCEIPTPIGAMCEPTRLRLRLLGEIEVARGGQRLTLPSSRKARALLAYLAATERPHRRDWLCSIFWDIPDDPRGALRSTLSKLRAIVDEPGRQRIVADRDTVRFDGSDVEIDLLALRQALAPGVDTASTPALEAAATAFRGEFAEGLTLSNCPEFHAWHVAEREETRRLHVLILQTLIQRLQAVPEAALPHARELVRVDRDAVLAHAALLRLLMASGRTREAEEQRDLSLKLLAEVSNSAANELALTWRSLVQRSDAAVVSQTIVERDSDKVPIGFGDPGEQGRKNVAEPSLARGLSGANEQTQAAPRILDPPPKPSILVLPFTNMSGDPEQEYFSDGVTEDIITDLSQVSAISVIARNTAFTFKGKAVEIGQVADKLKVGHVLEGSVRRVGDHIRITAQLIDAATGIHLWAERFDRVFRDIFALQDDISKNVVAALKLKLLPEELQAITTRPTLNAQAYGFYLEARAKLAVSWSTKDFLLSARRLFTRAATLDPGYARAYAGIADCEAFLWLNGDLDVTYEDMLTNSSKALELAPNLAEAHASKGIALYVAGHPDEAVATLKRAMDLDPELFEAHFFYGLSCRDIGDFNSAAVHYERAAELQSRAYQPLMLLADVYFALGRQELGESAARGCLTRIEDAFGPNPEVADVLVMGAVCLVCLGENERAVSWTERAVLLDPESLTVRYNAACTYAVVGKPEVALECLEFVFSQMPKARRWLIGTTKHDAQLNPLRDRPDFQDFMARLEADVAAHS
jgi:adenylate cyclase